MKRDKPVKLSVLFTGISSFTDEPINTFMKGESGIGKTYNTTETLKYFPQDQIWYLGGMSRKSLIHAYGVLLNRDGEPLDLDDVPERPELPDRPRKRDYEDSQDYQQAMREYASKMREQKEDYKERLRQWKEEIRQSYTLVDLTGKILVFLEAPDIETYITLLPILSHDKYEIEFMFVDKTGKGQLQTRRVIVRGFPATVFCSIDRKYMEELATRSFTVTPESSVEKIEEANKLTNLKASVPWKYDVETEESQIIKQILLSLRGLLAKEPVEVVIPFLELYKLFPKDITRDMRDFQHFVQLVKTITLLHFLQRAYFKKDGKKMLLCTAEDLKEGLEIYADIFETTRTGTDKRYLDFYHGIIKPEAGKKWYLKELTEKYNLRYKQKLSQERIRRMLERLDEIGYVNTEKDDVDKRLNVYVPLVTGEMSTIRHVCNLWRDSEPELKKDFENWKKTILALTCFYIHKNFAHSDSWGEAEISIHDVSMKVFEDRSAQNAKLFSSVEQEKTRIVSSEDLKSVPEKISENSRKLSTCRDMDNSEVQKVPVMCPLCNLPLPEDLRNCTTWKGKTVHDRCYVLEKQRLDKDQQRYD